MDNVIPLHAEQWAEAFSNADVSVYVSSKGKLRIVGDAELTFKEAVELFKMLRLAYTGEDDEDENGNSV